MKSIKTLVWRLLQFLKSLISPPQTEMVRPLPSEERSAGKPSTQVSIDGLNLSPRVFNCLWKADIHNIETVASMSDESLLNIHGFGIKALNELKERLTHHNLSENSNIETTQEVEQ